VCHPIAYIKPANIYTTTIIPNYNTTYSKMCVEQFSLSEKIVCYKIET
jgi:hypothetical protein